MPAVDINFQKKLISCFFLLISFPYMNTCNRRINRPGKNEQLYHLSIDQTPLAGLSLHKDFPLQTAIL